VLYIFILFQENDSVLAPAFINTPANAVSTDIAAGSASGPSPQPSTGNAFRDQLITALDIPLSLVERPSGAIDMRDAWAKFQAHKEAISLLRTLRRDGNWALRKPTGDEMIECFVSKSSWHDHYRKLFPEAETFPVLVDWLNQDGKAPSSLDLWGVDKGRYSFKDLEALLGRLRVKRDRKEKRKAHGSVDEGGRYNKKSKKASDI